ncbi:MAG: putative Ig domain-containing protein, partial [Synergistaceae bacterium]|nr:putative Ig domain-containing protein [Synergistaceae bacterium]
YIPSGVTSVDLSGNVSLDAFFADGGELEYLDLSENSQLRVIKAHTPAIAPCIAAPIPQVIYLDVSSSDLTQLNLDGTSLDYLACSPQNHSGTMSTDSSAEYPYSFDFRTIVSEDNLGRIIPGSIQILDENGGTITDYLSDNWIYRFRTPPHTIKYKYDTGALGITMDVTITMKYEYLIVRPVFTFSSKDIPEGTTGKAYSLDITVSGTAPFRWRITSGKLPGGLTLGETTGRISGTPTESGSFTVTISVSNSVYTVSITVTIVIREAVTAPVLSAVTLDTGTVSEYYSFTLKAVGTGITWSISGNPSWLHINASTGEIYGTPARAGTFTFTVTATNSAGSVSHEYTLIILGGSTTTTTGPTITTTSITCGTVSESYRFVFTAAGTGTITWYLVSGTLPAGLTLNTDGSLTGTPTEDGTFTFTVGAYDSTGIRTTRTYTITINAGSSSEAPRITASSPLPDGTASTAYSYQLTASGTSPLTWTISGGSLPSGLSLSSSGLISGTPTTAGVFRFTVIVQNIHGEYTMEFTITIRAGSGTKPDITAIYTLADGYIGVRYSATLYAEGTRAINWRLTAGNLPAGLTLNANGTVTGTPTAAGEYVFTVEAVNDWGNDIAVFRITIYTDEGQCCNNQSEDVSGGLIYEYRRTISSLTEYELAMLPGDIYISLRTCCRGSGLR